MAGVALSRGLPLQVPGVDERVHVPALHGAAAADANASSCPSSCPGGWVPPD